VNAALDWNAYPPLIAILRGIVPDEVEAHVGELLDAGFGLVEIPCNSPRWRESVERALAFAADRAVVGAGTVTQREQVDALASTGAGLMVTPNTDPPLIRHAVACGLSCATGFATASEAFAALAAGTQALKLFPAGALGTAYVRALQAVLPADVPLFAVGGISPANLADFLRAGCTGAGLGGELYRPEQPPSETRARARAFMDAYKGFAS
jgi:2-dehydro-3-deoxyphosphogalactonate aldolase